VSLTVLAQEILPVITDVPVFVAGGIGRGNAIAAYLEMGASGVQLGTRFAAAAESVAHDKFKAAFVRASARDALSSVQIDPRLPVIPVRALKNAGSEAFNERQREVAAAVDRGEMDLAAGQLAIEHYWAGALRRAVVDGDIEGGSLMAGQSVGMVTSVQPVAEIIAELTSDAEAALSRRTVREAAA
jgi:enoyl-[acyl-carrier protein] reductase II